MWFWTTCSPCSQHGRFDLIARGDVQDDHHSVEDIGIALGEAFAWRGDKGIHRYGHTVLPMDEP